MTTDRNTTLPTDRQVWPIGRTLMIEALSYPGQDGQFDTIEIGLCDVCVRASDGIRVGYDFGRDGWVIKQASGIMHRNYCDINDDDWREVAFVKSWGSMVDADD